VVAIVFVLIFPGLGQGILDFGFWIGDFGGKSKISSSFTSLFI
jgi:hypothetical protein